MNIFILAGEPSGDEYGAELMKQMQGQNSEIQFHGIGGPLMAQYGLKSMIDFNQMSVMGFVEILKSIGFFIALEKKIVRFIEEHSFDKIVLIDYQGAPPILGQHSLYVLSDVLGLTKEKIAELQERDIIGK